MGCDPPARTDLTREQLGRLADGGARALRGWRDKLTNPKPTTLVPRALNILDADPDWDRCQGAQKCDRCSASKPERCRFPRSGQSLVFSVPYTTEGTIRPTTAHRYLWGTVQRPCGATSWYAEFAAWSQATATRGAAVAARTLRAAKRGDEALQATKVLSGGDQWDISSKSLTCTARTGVRSYDARLTSPRGTDISRAR